MVYKPLYIVLCGRFISVLYTMFILFVQFVKTAASKEKREK